jgi:hypothetical protein
MTAVMHTKVTIFGLALFLGLMAPASAIGKARVESTKERAAASQKLIAFVIMQDCKNPSCPIAVNRVGDRNGSIKRAIPNKGVIVLKLDPEDLQDADIPECVRKTKSVPCIIITNAACTEVIDSLGAGTDKARIAEMESKIDAAIKKLPNGAVSKK